MDVKHAYNTWADQYDTNRNRTRDLEAVSLREILHARHFKNCLEIGCGTGKNTEWLMEHVDAIMAVDLSEEMLNKAKQKISAEKITFVQADILQDWSFAIGPYDLVTFSLVLEHIEDLNLIFQKVKDVTREGSLVYIGELHPFKQYNGTKARFDTEEGQQIVTCFDHHISDFTTAATENGFTIKELREYFDDNDRNSVPRIFTLLLEKTGSS